MDTTQLQRFILEHDAQVAVNVQLDGSTSIDTLQSAIKQQGFRLCPHGQLEMLADDGSILFSLSPNALFSESLSRITLMMDVPCVLPDDDAFGKMISCARELAAQFGGAVVDDAGKPLTEAAFAEIAGQITKFHAGMEAAGIPAGSAEALKLFATERLKRNSGCLPMHSESSTQ